MVRVALWFVYQACTSRLLHLTTCRLAACPLHAPHTALSCHFPSRPQVRAAVPMYLLARKIKALGIKVVLSGEGADEIFGGYLYFHKVRRGHGPATATVMVDGRIYDDIMQCELR